MKPRTATLALGTVQFGLPYGVANRSGQAPYEVARDILASIEGAMSSNTLIEVIYRVFLSGDLSTPQNDPPLTLTIFEINATPMKIRALAGFRDIGNKRFPAGEYSTEQFPGLTPQ